MADSVRPDTRADHVRKRRAAKIGRSKGSSLKRKRAGRSRNYESSPPVFVRGGKAELPTRKIKRSKTRRRYNLTLGAAGSEVRVPALPKIRLGWRFVSAVLVSLISAAIWFVMTSPYFRVTNAEVYGLEYRSMREVSQVLNIDDSLIFDLDAEKMMSDLMNAFPDFSSVDVRVILPKQVIVKVEERVPVLALQTNDKILWVDENGIAFPPRDEMDELPIVVPEGIKLAEDNTKSLLTTDIYSRELLPPEVVSMIQRISEDVPKDTPIIYSGEHGIGWEDSRGWQVFFGESGDDLEVRLKMYKRLLKMVRQEGTQPQFISMEYIHAPYFRLDR